MNLKTNKHTGSADTTTVDLGNIVNVYTNGVMEKFTLTAVESSKKTIKREREKERKRKREREEKERKREGEKEREQREKERNIKQTLHLNKQT